MIHVEITCDLSDQPRARDAKRPCDSTRGRSLVIDAVGVLGDLKRAIDRAVERAGWKRWAIPALGRRKGYVCANCYARAKGEI